MLPSPSVPSCISWTGDTRQATSGAVLSPLPAPSNNRSSGRHALQLVDRNLKRARFDQRGTGGALARAHRPAEEKSRLVWPWGVVRLRLPEHPCHANHRPHHKTRGTHQGHFSCSWQWEMPSAEPQGGWNPIKIRTAPPEIRRTHWQWSAQNPRRAWPFPHPPR